MILIIGIIYGSLITLTDQIIEHNLLKNNKYKTYISFIFIIFLLTLVFYISILHKEILPFLVGLNIYWLLFGKIHNIEFIVYIVGFFIILLKYYEFNIVDIYIIFFTLFYNILFKIKFIKEILNKGKIGYFLYRFMGRYYILSFIFIIFFNNLNIGLFNIGSTFISFILAKKYIISQNKK